MKFFALPNIATILAVSASLVVALPLEAEANTINTTRSTTSNDCSMDKIRECVADTGLESTICFKQVCAGVQGTPRKTKRQEDQCTEENLLQCAVMEWREAEVCFQEFCL
ncbi:hypothetical protein GL218_05925 [Daldinia childiae]|uniref:uncharacterized protein n=1 Tax=Daldinia childiae TaxID=326645 RepID=UPI001445FA63|nr:uncharacterized protein GL218_05925 [Daldinia childiae]KAF3058527.1 hypothetical protein GL218_05925 [Daldinia childiae]